MDGTFHRFPELPWELRDQIWNLAIRPARPGVQVFKMYSPEKDKIYNPEKDKMISNAMDVVFDYYSVYSDYRIAVPDRDDNNLSTYCIDGALWNTCKEPRRVIERKFKSPRGSREMVSLIDEQGEPDAPATGYFKDYDGATQYLTVLPNQDLFLFQLEDPGTIGWGNLDTEVPLCSPTWGFKGRRDIALEYKPEWGLQLGKGMAELYHEPPIIQELVRMAIDSYNPSTIWLVDYNLRCKQGVAMEEGIEEPRVFYARDRRLVQVDCLTHPWQQFEYIEEVEVEEDEANEYLKDNSSSITFANTAHHAAFLQWDCWEQHNNYPCSIGLLGWEPL